MVFWPEGRVAKALFLSGAAMANIRFPKMRGPLPESPNETVSHSLYSAL